MNRTTGFRLLCFLPLLTPTPALAKRAAPLTILSFGTDPAPCRSSDAREPQRLALAHEITPTPGLPSELTECRVAVAPPMVVDGSAVTGVYEQLGRTVLAEPMPSKRHAGTFELIVLSNPRVGREVEFNRWYDGEHVPDVLRNPGFVSAQRFRLIADATAGYRLPRYAVRFTFQSPDLSATMAEVRRRLTTGLTRPSDAFDMATSVTRYYARAVGHLGSPVPGRTTKP